MLMKLKQQDARIERLDSTVKCADQQNDLMKREGGKCFFQTQFFSIFPHDWLSILDVAFTHYYF